MIALDTNILVYAEGMNDSTKQATAKRIMAGVGKDELTICTQVLSEFFHVLRRKARLPNEDILRRVGFWSAIAGVSGVTPDDWTDAVTLATTHGLQIFDAVILAAAANAGAGLLLSEDMHDGFAWRGTTIANPFAAHPSPLLATLPR